MEIKILSPLWGHEHEKIDDFVHRAKEAGYDGLDTWVPEDRSERQRFHDCLKDFDMVWVAHQHQANGTNFNAFKASFRHYLELCTEGDPLLVYSHTGKDYFPMEQNLELIDIANAFSEERGIIVAHETHRGRIGFHPAMTMEYFKARSFPITADLSHWVCTTESFLENFPEALDQAIDRTCHIHARVGFEEGPQIPDPRAPEWQHAVDRFFTWWDRMVGSRRQAGAPWLTITTEFGPPPYLPTIPFTSKPVADQFTINCYMKDLLRKRYG